MKIGNGLDLQSQKIVNLADPSSAQDAATKIYVDNVARGLSWKDAVRVATTTNGTLATAYVNGQTVDGVALVTGDRILLKNQTTGADNGIYVVQGSGAPVRAVDADGVGDLKPGSAVSVAEGTANADTVWHITSDAAITIGTTSQTWSQLGGGSSNTAGDGIAIVGGAVSVVPKTDGGLVVDGAGVSVDPSLVARKYSANIGDGTSTSIAVTHGLGTKDIAVSLRKNSDDAGFFTDWVATDINTVTVTFAVAPASGEHRITVIG